MKPVIFLAFANDPVSDNAYLRNLPKERRQISTILDNAQKDGLCEVVVKPNVIIDDIFDVFSDERYRDRIAVFHFAGHADSYRLLLEPEKGDSSYRRVNWPGKKEDKNRFPWRVEYNKEKKDKTKKWTLKIDPLAGLTIPKSIGYPKPPYRYLQRYERKHARIFFGRSMEIRAL